MSSMWYENIKANGILTEYGLSIEKLHKVLIKRSLATIWDGLGMLSWQAEL